MVGVGWCELLTTQQELLLIRLDISEMMDLLLEVCDGRREDYAVLLSPEEEREVFVSLSGHGARLSLEKI